jgi:hypothetical protein
MAAVSATTATEAALLVLLLLVDLVDDFVGNAEVFDLVQGKALVTCWEHLSG